MAQFTSVERNEIVRKILAIFHGMPTDEAMVILQIVAREISHVSHAASEESAVGVFQYIPVEDK